MLRYLILADGDFGPMTSKTANSVIRYRPGQVAAVLDRSQAGRTVEEVLGFGGDTPVVATVAEGLARGANAVLVGKDARETRSQMISQNSGELARQTFGIVLLYRSRGVLTRSWTRILEAAAS